MIELKGEKYYTLKDLEKMMDKQLQTLQRYCRTGVIKATKKGREYIVKESDLKAYFDQE
ncbi:helix-turn-helix domain-containing protein [candidate division KSB3 bacterium]|nr:helix-turn-helix domain-containing protein [candidate division KSB3 bacterium]